MRKQWRVGALCGREHRYQDTDGSLRSASGHCIRCDRLVKKQRYAANPEVRHKARERNRKKSPWKYADLSGTPARTKISREEQQGRQRNFKRKLRAEHPEKAAADARKNYKKNSTRIKLRQRVYSALKAGQIKKSKALAAYGIDLAAIADHLGQMPGDNYHIDHIRPLSSFDFSDSAQIRAAFMPENHQWLTAHENLKKHNTYA